MYKMGNPNTNKYFNNQEEQYYGYKTNNTYKKNKRYEYDQNSNPNIIQEDSSKEMGTTSNKNNRSSRKFSKAKSQRGISSNSSFYSSSNIKDRIEKACPTNNPSDMKKQITLLHKQIQRLQKQILKKDKQLLESKNAVIPTKQNQTEIMQLYRIVNYYEGKIKQMEIQITKFRDLILKINSNQGIKTQELNIIFQEFTEHNENLSGKYEELEFQKNMLENKYKRVQSKYHDAHRQLTQYRRKQQDPLNKNNSQRAHYMYELLKSQPHNLISKQQYYNIQAYSARIKQLQQDFEQMKSENQVLRQQLQDKNNQVTSMHKEYIQLKKSYKSLRTIQDNKSNMSKKTIDFK